MLPQAIIPLNGMQQLAYQKGFFLLLEAVYKFDDGSSESESKLSRAQQAMLQTANPKWIESHFIGFDCILTDLKKELFETINSLENGQNNVLCRFPLRVKWLKENIPSLEKDIVNYSCAELDEFLTLVDAKHVTMVFPTAHINSPASMYGHTFLRVSSNEETPLISNAVNFAAKTDDTNGLIFAYKGLFGEYEGRYSILPYYEKIKEYNNLEQRDIWEYDLNLTQDEIDRLVLHAFELKDSYSDYFFFKENCSYNILWLLEVARYDLDLVSHFTFKTVPLDSIKILKPYNLIKDSRFRYSNMRKMKNILLFNFALSI